MALALLCQFSVTPSATHNQIGPFWCCFPGGWACVCSGPLWVSPRNSPVRLGVSPIAASTSKRFSISGLRLYFPTLEPWVVQSIARSPASCSFAHPAPQSATSLGPPAATLPRVLSARLPVSAPPTGLDECVFFNPLVLDLHTVRFSVSSGCFLFLNCCCPSFGCGKRHSVSPQLPSWPEVCQSVLNFSVSGYILPDYLFC